MSPNDNLCTIMTYELKLTSADAYLKAALFIGANIALPYLFHLIPGGGVMFLPVYVFTLCGALCYGWQLGALTAVMTPLVGSLFFGAPVMAMVSDMMLKGVMLAVVAAMLVKWNRKAMLLNPLLAVCFSWLLVGLLFGPMLIAGFVMLAKSPEFLKKRLDAKEKQGTQKGVVAFSGLMFLVGFLAWR